MKVLFAVLKKDIDVALMDYSNSIYALLSSSSNSSSPASVIIIPPVALGFLSLCMKALYGRAIDEPKPDVYVLKKPLVIVDPKPCTSILFS